LGVPDNFANYNRNLGGGEKEYVARERRKKMVFDQRRLF